MVHDEQYTKSSRRAFIQAAATLLGGAAITACGDSHRATPEPSPEQCALKKSGRSKVMLYKVASYEQIDEAMRKVWAQIAPDVKGKSVFLKVDLVDFRGVLPVFTNPTFLHSLIKVLQNAGSAQIVLGDGPALSRDCEHLVKLSGIADVCKKESIEFVDLNIDEVDKVANPLKFTGVAEFLLPKSVTKSDILISVPKLKTHNWALLSGSMQNLCGVVPGRKYGWPKSILHVKGINSSILDITSMLKPSFAIVDGIVAVEGDGPLHGSAKNLSALIVGNDLVAVDTVAAMCMELPNSNIPYLRIAGKVLGNNELSQIDIVGDAIDSIKQKFKLPSTYQPDGIPKDLKKFTSAAESALV